MRSTITFPIEEGFIERLVTYIGQQELGMCFLGKGWNFDGDCLAGIGMIDQVESAVVTDSIEFCKDAGDVVFCHLNYEVKDQLEALQSRHQDTTPFELFKFFIPEVVFQVSGSNVTVSFYEERQNEAAIREMMEAIHGTETPSGKIKGGRQFHRLDEAHYLEALQSLKQHIQRGDVYQANYCQEFYWEQVELNPSALFMAGFNRMPNPFSVFYRNGASTLMSFSPERFLEFNGRIVRSQPMKGTSPRDPDHKVDEKNRETLRKSEKDRRENVMIVDLVRNDLSHFAARGSVTVPELYRIETYPRVHQMYSTVEATLKEGAHPIEALLKAFPMGSMTGAPKVRAMQILEQLERSKRGIYSGTVGFMLPKGTGDFNVVIRSLVHSSETNCLSLHAGGGITDLSDPAAEYEECLVKARPLFELVQDHFEESAPTLPLTREAATT